MDFLIIIRDNIDKLFYPFVAILIKNRKTIRFILAVVIIFSFTTLLIPAFHKNLGQLAWLLLLTILFLSPISKISQSKALTSLMIFRREMGITMSILAMEHITLYFIKYQEHFNTIFNSGFWIQNERISYKAFGLAALVATLPLFITSNNFSMKILKNNWKKLHRLVYVLLILVALHTIVIKQEYLKTLVILFAYGVLKLLVARGVKIPAVNTENSFAVSLNKVKTRKY